MANQAPISPAAAARAVADRLDRLTEEVRRSFAETAPQQRVARLKQASVEIQAGSVVVFNWLERWRHPDTVDLMKRRIVFVASEAVACAGMDIPEYAGGEVHAVSEPPSAGAARTAQLAITAKMVADSLRGWAADIEYEDSQREPLPHYPPAPVDPNYTITVPLKGVPSDVLKHFGGDVPSRAYSPPPPSPARHSTDFRSVHWYGMDYRFTAGQAPVVRVLWENWAQGTPDVGDSTLLEAVDREAPPARLNVLFRGHPAWGVMIVEGETRSSHRLNPQPKS